MADVQMSDVEQPEAKALQVQQQPYKLLEAAVKPVHSPPHSPQRGALAGQAAAGESGPASPSYVTVKPTKSTRSESRPPVHHRIVLQPFFRAKNLILVFGALMCIWVFCWLYVGFSWQPLTRLKYLEMAVLDCDVVPPASALNASFAQLLPTLAPAPIASLLLQSSIYNASNPASSTFGWVTQQCPTATGGPTSCGSTEQECVQALYDSVYQGGYWALLYYSSNFTTQYLSWYAGAGISPPLQAPSVTYVYGRGRDYSSHTYLLQGVVFGLLPKLSQSFMAGLASKVQAVQLLASPTLLALGFPIHTVDLVPVTHFGQNFASYVFCILLWLGSAFMSSVMWAYKLPAEMDCLDPGVPPEAKPSTRRLLVAYVIKAWTAMLFMFVLIVLLCSVLWALGGGDEQWHYNPGYALAFGWFMSWSFLSINASLLHGLGVERFSSASALLLILQLTSASAILNEHLSNNFFFIGQAFPFFYGVRGFRTIFFGGLTNKMYINWLVLLAYNVVLGPLALYFMASRLRRTGRHNLEYEAAAVQALGAGFGAEEDGLPGSGADGAARGKADGTTVVFVGSRRSTLVEEAWGQVAMSAGM